jgi:DNA helicase-2/ATP-dependent DNA helicase PcrA
MRAAEDPYTFPAQIPPRARAGLAALAEALQRARRPGFGAPQGMLEALSDYYAPILKARFDDYPKRLKDLDQLHLLAGRSSSLEAFLSELALEPPRDAAEEGLTSDPDTETRLVLSTVHSAKGLEWHSVFVLWTMEGRFPSFAALNNPDELEEERRLMYVAMTRAEQNLYLCCPCQAWDPISGGHLSRPSRFLDEIGTPLTDTWLLSPG